MALQWIILTYAVAAEVALAVLLALPSPKLLKNRLVSLVSLILQPAFFIVPFAGFHLLGSFSAPISDLILLIMYRFFIFGGKIYKAQRNVILCAAACLIYWSIYRICKYEKDIQRLEEVEKRCKAQ